jgi:hypothetical protein
LTRSINTHSVSVVHEQTPFLPHIEARASPRFDVFSSTWVHYGSTFGIVTICFIGAAAAPSVATVWSLCGSSMAFVISFLLPAACYLKIQRCSDEGWIWKYFSWFLVIFSIVGSISCSVQTILRFLKPS